MLGRAKDLIIQKIQGWGVSDVIRNDGACCLE
jgi:hypothetical protein